MVEQLSARRECLWANELTVLTGNFPNSERGLSANKDAA